MVKRYKYKCDSCNHTFVDDQSGNFIKTTLKKCPSCGSTNVHLKENSIKRVLSFAKKIKQ